MQIASAYIMGHAVADLRRGKAVLGTLKHLPRSPRRYSDYCRAPHQDHAAKIGVGLGSSLKYGVLMPAFSMVLHPLCK